MPLFQASGLLLSLNLSELIDYLVQFLCGIGICFSKGIELVDHGVGDLSLFGNAVNALFVVADNDIEMPGFLLDIIRLRGCTICVRGIWIPLRAGLFRRIVMRVRLVILLACISIYTQIVIL